MFKTKGVCRFHDPNGDGFHATDDPDKAAQHLVNRTREWVCNQPVKARSRFCEHGHYAGENKVLASVFCCFCKENVNG